MLVDLFVAVNICSQFRIFFSSSVRELFMTESSFATIAIFLIDV